MKKLLTAAVASTFAFLAMGVVNGDEIINQGADFEAAGFVEGAQFNAGLSDDAQSTGDKYWYTEDTEADNVISNHSGAVGAPRPDKFASDANTKFLKVETSGKLWRSVKNNSGSSDFLTNTVQSLETYGHSLTDSAIYLDTLVKFTPADSDFSSDLTDGDKIAISYVEREEERDSNDNVTVEAATNFVIRAGLIVGGQLFQTNYYAYLPDDPSLENFDKDAWHRLTVRTIPDVGDGSVGFVVYVDETNLTYSTSVDAGFGTLDATAQGFYNSEKHALFPSAVGSGAGKLMISAASFSGNGSIDDVVFTTTTPGFIEATESIAATITLGTGISSVTVSVSGTPVEPADSTANPLVFNLAPGTTDFTLAVTADTANGYTFDDATGITAENASYANGTVTISGGAPTLTLKAIRNNVNYIDGDNNPTSCVSLATAFANAKSGTTITLAYGLDANAVEGNAFAGYQITGKTVTLDLNGNSIIAVDKKEEALFTINPGAKLIVIDSSSANTGTIDYDTEYAVFYADGECEVGATTGDYGPKIVGPLVDPADDSAVKVIRGKLDGDGNSTAGAFNRNDYVDDNSEVSSALVDGFWVVAPKGSGDEDWKDPSEITKDATAGDTYGITGDLAAADALELTEWATGVGSVTFANKDTINIDCFLLNIANNSTAAQIQDEKDEFVVNISFDSVTGEPVVTAPTGKTYNGKLIIKGSDDLSIPKANWDEQTDGDTFFYGVLSL